MKTFFFHKNSQDFYWQFNCLKKDPDDHHLLYSEIVIHTLHYSLLITTKSNFELSDENKWIAFAL